ncbi:hypothetical protein SAMN06265365_101681 [Tistlia consotensis]|uniref:DUF1062 domain-containing protein n=1 Tax=Tistlia consotensis USBA 355 TaxID=560819 RepID=A0A1Y6B7M3_9PROT|nr:DUF1062 domain-containing protein [Tistlia consotensis]SME94446.1 hypothetical protein SAMN05428998_101680 [Tistlia consotensis USBA 355]SNR29339.1 hypothetical protein SAMN06265365_101681 [Tistlia consotensis]
MSDRLSVLWTIVPLIAPQPWLPCSRCGEVTAFRSSGRFRINANGRRVDAWLVYRCTRCQKSWNRPVLERRPVASLDPGLLRALTANDPAEARAVAFDLDGLRRRAERVELCSEVAITRRPRSGVAASAAILAIELVAPLPLGLRLDRLLAEGLGVPRGRVAALHDAGRLLLEPAGKRGLRRPLRDRQGVTLDLAAEPDGAEIARAAAGAA